MKKKSLGLTGLCLLLVCTCFFTACKSTEGSTPDEAVTQITQGSSTDAINSTANVPTSAETTVSATPTEKEDTQTMQGMPADRDESTKTATINVGGKDYTVNVGDRIVYTCYLTTPKKIENIQATLTYDDSVLWLRQSSSEEMFPMFSSIVYNANVTGRILFNASNPVSGFNFTDKGVVVRLNFDVAKEGYTSIATAIEFMDEIGGTPYIENFNIVGNITIEEALS